jgi:multicomponent Na+:H+ antiporter subunit B
MIRAHESVIVQMLSRLLVPLVQLYALFILFFGQYGPGGGFVGGVMFGASVILGMLVFGPDTPSWTVATKLLQGDGVGLIIFVAVGGLCLIAGGEFLNYAEVGIPGLDAASRRYLGIVMTQIGVAADVAVTAISIVYTLSAVQSSGGPHA